MTEKVGIIFGWKKVKQAEKYDVGTSTISDIKENAHSITRYVNNLNDEKGSLTRKTMKTPIIGLLEDTVYTWFMKKKSSWIAYIRPFIVWKNIIF